MAHRHTLHISHLPRFKAWLQDRGWEFLPLSKHGYEVLRARNGKRTLIIYKKLNAQEHLSYMDRDWQLIQDFLDFVHQEGV